MHRGAQSESLPLPEEIKYGGPQSESLPLPEEIKYGGPRTARRRKKKKKKKNLTTRERGEHRAEFLG